MAGKCPSANKSDQGQKEDVCWEREELFSVRGQALLTQTRYAMLQGHHLTMPTSNTIILTDYQCQETLISQTLKLFICSPVTLMKGSQIPELLTQLFSSCPGIKLLASLWYQSLQEMPLSKLHSLHI